MALPARPSLRDGRDEMILHSRTRAPLYALLGAPAGTGLVLLAAMITGWPALWACTVLTVVLTACLWVHAELDDAFGLSDRELLSRRFELLAARSRQRADHAADRPNDVVLPQFSAMTDACG